MIRKGKILDWNLNLAAGSPLFQQGRLVIMAQGKPVRAAN